MNISDNKNSNNLNVSSLLSFSDSKINNSINENGKSQNIYKNDISKTNTNKYKSMKNSKIVKIIDTPIIIDVECWKQYNYDQTADENLEDYLEDLEKKEKDNDTELTDNNKNKQRNKAKTENVTCTCNLI